MKKSPKFSPEVGELAVRMEQKHESKHPSRCVVIEDIANKIGGVPQTLDTWVK